MTEEVNKIFDMSPDMATVPFGQASTLVPLLCSAS